MRRLAILVAMGFALALAVPAVARQLRADWS